MKKIILAGSLFALSLSSYSEKIISNNNQQKETKKMGTIHITKADFLAKVANYEKILRNGNTWVINLVL